MLITRTLAAAFSGITRRRMLGTYWARTRTNPIPSFWLGGPTAQGASSCSIHLRSQAGQEPMCPPSSGSLMPSISSGSHRTAGGAQSSRGLATHNTRGAPADGTLMTKAQQLAQLESQGRVRCEACVLRPVFYIDGRPVSEGVEFLQPLPRAEVRVSGYPEEQIARHGNVFARRFHRARNW